LFAGALLAEAFAHCSADEWAANVGRSMEPFELKLRHHLAPTAAVTALARGVSSSACLCKRRPCKLAASLTHDPASRELVFAKRAPHAPGDREAGVRTLKGFTRASLDMPHQSCPSDSAALKILQAWGRVAHAKRRAVPCGLEGPHRPFKLKVWFETLLLAQM